MMPRELASQFLQRALEESKLTRVALAEKTGVTLRNVHYLLARGTTFKHSCRFDTLVALLDACGWELEARKKQ